MAAVTAIAPHAGAVGSQVTISGTVFGTTQDVCFGQVASPRYRVTESGTRITAVVPPGSGTVQVAVITAAGLSTETRDDTFTYGGSAAAGASAGSATALSLCDIVPAVAPS